MCISINSSNINNSNSSNNNSVIHSSLTTNSSSHFKRVFNLVRFKFQNIPGYSQKIIKMNNQKLLQQTGYYLINHKKLPHTNSGNIVNNNEQVRIRTTAFLKSINNEELPTPKKSNKLESSLIKYINDKEKFY